jgi:hypothetical protein
MQAMAKKQPGPRRSGDSLSEFLYVASARSLCEKEPLK